jgi:hypothetical protein
VETFVPDHELGLVAEMKVPGRAWLQFEVEANSRDSVIQQTAILPDWRGFSIGKRFILCIAGFSAACSTRLPLSQDRGRLFPRSGHDSQFSRDPDQLLPLRVA